jgi:hypothetical protein
MTSRSSGLNSLTFSRSCRQSFMASNNSGSRKCRIFARPTDSDAKAPVLSSYTILGITTYVKSTRQSKDCSYCCCKAVPGEREIYRQIDGFRVATSRNCGVVRLKLWDLDRDCSLNVLRCFFPGSTAEMLYGFRGTNDSKGGIEKDVVKACSGGWVPS